MVCLASRPYGGHYRNMGRETFLVSVEWEDDWPLVNPGKGIIEWEMPKPNLPEARWPALPACDHFDAPALEHRWNFIRTPRGEFWSLSERPGYLRLRLKSASISEVCNPSFVGRRQQDISYAVRTKIEFTPNTGKEAAGLVLLQNQDYQYRLECGLDDDSQREVRLVSRINGEEKVLSARALLRTRFI